MNARWYAAVAVMLAAGTGALHAADINWQGGSGTWDASDTSHWNPAQVPGQNDNVYITQAAAGTVTVAFDVAGGTTVYRLDMSNSSGVNHLNLDTGDSLSTYASGGRLYLGSGAKITVGSGATLRQEKVGTGAYNYFELNGGEIVVDGGTLYGGSPTRCRRGSVQVLSGSYTANAGIELGVGNGYEADMLLDNADADLSFSLGFGVLDVGYGSGTGTATLEIKNAANWDLNDTTINVTGVLRGYGTVTGGSGDDWTVNGKVIADGYGSEETLDFSGLNGAWGSSAENSDDKGWYAENKGLLRMFDLTLVSSGTELDRSWGESATDADIDRVNSVRFEPGDFAGTGNTYVYGYLYDPTRSDVPTLPLPATYCRSVHRFRFHSNRYYDYCDVTIRYDEPSPSADPDGYSVYWMSEGGSSWTEMAMTLDTTKKHISFILPDPGVYVSGFGWFAVFHEPTGSIFIVK